MSESDVHLGCDFMECDYKEFRAYIKCLKRINHILQLSVVFLLAGPYETKDAFGGKSAAATLLLLPLLPSGVARECAGSRRTAPRTKRCSSCT